jgi:hypothetical protein
VVLQAVLGHGHELFFRTDPERAANVAGIGSDQAQSCRAEGIGGDEDSDHSQPMVMDYAHGDV